MDVKMMISSVLVCIMVSATGTSLYAHCEIPCGIYDDSLRVALIAEHIGTVEKSMKTIITLQKEKTVDYNQLVRWIDNKETHAIKIQEIVTQYFMHQRIKPVANDKTKEYTKYIKELTLLHRMLIDAMKCKQSTDTAHIAELRKSLAAFESSYFKKK